MGGNPFNPNFGMVPAVFIDREDYPVPAKRIGQAMGKEPGYISRYRRRLLDSGILRAESYGHVAFALPLFGEYITRFQL